MELGAGSDDDLVAALDRLLPRDDRYVHSHGSPGHGADHVLPLLVPPSISVPVAGRPAPARAHGSRSRCSTPTRTTRAGACC